MSILEKLMAANTVLNARKPITMTVMVKAKRDVDYCVKLLLKGYSLDHDMKALMIKYGHIMKVPDAKVHAGKFVSSQIMEDLMETIYPKIPHNHLVMIMVQNFKSKVSNYISNGERSDMVIALRSMADNMEDGKDFVMPTEN